MFVRRITVSLAALLLMLGAVATGQNLAPVPSGTNGGGAMLPELTISTRVDEVNLAFTVTDKKGHFITDLRKDDFDVRDNRVPPQALRYFQQQSNLPLNVALLIDASDSV